MLPSNGHWFLSQIADGWFPPQAAECLLDLENGIEITFTISFFSRKKPCFWKIAFKNAYSYLQTEI